jgi:hypothetical protein
MGLTFGTGGGSRDTPVRTELLAPKPQAPPSLNAGYFRGLWRFPAGGSALINDCPWVDLYWAYPTEQQNGGRIVLVGWRA